MHAEIPSLGPRGVVLTPADRIDNYLRVLNALMLRDMRTRFLGSYWGYLIQVLWPVAHLAIITGAMVFRKLPPPICESTMVFVASGAIPALAFQYISREIMKGSARSRPLTYYPQVRVLDLVFANCMVEVVSSFLGVMVVFGILIALGNDPIPHDIVTSLGGYLCAILLGLGMGTINVTIVAVFPGWVLGYVLVTILLYITSGVFFLPSNLPAELYAAMKWNPLVQIIEWVRLGYEPTLPVEVDYIYVLLWCGGTLMVGLSLDRTFGRSGGG